MSDVTTLISLQKPAEGTVAFDDALNANMDILDSRLGVLGVVAGEAMEPGQAAMVRLVSGTMYAFLCKSDVSSMMPPWGIIYNQTSVSSGGVS